MTVYYMQNGLADYQQNSKVTAFKPVGSVLPIVHPNSPSISSCAPPEVSEATPPF